MAKEEKNVKPGENPLGPGTTLGPQEIRQMDTTKAVAAADVKAGDKK